MLSLPKKKRITPTSGAPIELPLNIKKPFIPVYGSENDFITPLEIHKQYGVVDIPGVKVIGIEKSKIPGKKYSITISYDGYQKTINYGSSEYQQFKDRTPIGAYSNANHYDNTRRKSYLARASKITDKTGLAANNPFSPNRYSIITLW